MTPTETETVARDYIAAVGAGDLAPLATLLGDSLEATFAGAILDKTGWIAALERLLPALVRNDILEVFTAGDRACIVYDFVTDTSAGAVRCVELLSVADGAITRVELLLDRVQFGPVNAALAERSAR